MGFSAVLRLIKDGDFSAAKQRLLQYLDNGEVKLDDVQLVANYYTSSKSVYVAYVLYRMQCATGMYFEAYETFMDVLKQCQRKKDMWFSDITYKASDDTIDRIYADLILRLQGDIDIPLSLLVSQVVDEMIAVLWRRNDSDKYAMIANFARLIWFNELKESTCLYELAYSCAEVDEPLAEKLYLKVLEKEPANSQALNNIGLFYEKKSDFEKAKLYYQKAYQFCSTQDIYRQNYERVCV